MTHYKNQNKQNNNNNNNNNNKVVISSINIRNYTKDKNVQKTLRLSLETSTCIYRGDDKSLARPGRKQATATKL